MIFSLHFFFEEAVFISWLVGK